MVSATSPTRAAASRHAVTELPVVVVEYCGYSGSSTTVSGFQSRTAFAVSSLSGCQYRMAMKHLASISVRLDSSAAACRRVRSSSGDLPPSTA